MKVQLGFGAASIGNLFRPVSDQDSEEVLDAAWEGGVRYFDTAPHYGLGLSERRLGEFLKSKPRETYVLSTKVGRILESNPHRTGALDPEGFAVPDDLVRRYDPSFGGLERSLTDSLMRMGLDRVDTVFLHDPDVYNLDDGLRRGLPALSALRELGLVKRVGVGVNSVQAAIRAIREGDLDVLMIAGRYTLLEQPAVEELLPLAIERGVEVIAAAVFNSGLLAADRPATAHYNYRAVQGEVIERVERLRQVCAQYQVALPAAALQFPLRHPAIDTVVVGTARASALRENLAHLQAPIPNELWIALENEGLTVQL